MKNQIFGCSAANLSSYEGANSRGW